MEKKPILYDSPEAASLQTVTGWVDSNGRFWGNDEHMARLSGCTHKKCSCGAEHIKSYTMCHDCRRREVKARYLQLSFKEWDGVEFVYSNSLERYFFGGVEELEEYLEDEELGDDIDLRLVFLKEEVYNKVKSDYWDGVIPEDSDIPEELQKALDELNKVVESLPVACYYPGNIRTEYRAKKEGKEK